MHKQFMFAALLLLSACDEAPTSQSTGGEAVVPPEAKPVAIGQTGKAKGVDFTVTKVRITNQVGPAGIGPKAEAGETFVVVNYTLKNTSSEPLTLMERPDLTLIDGNGQSYAADDVAGVMVGGMMDDASGMVADLNPGVSAKTGTAWKVAKEGFDKASWRLVVNTDPVLTFALGEGDGKAH